METAKMPVIKIALFAAALAVTFAAAYAVGAEVDPDVGDSAEADHGGDHPAEAGGPARLVVEDVDFAPGVEETLAFRVVDRGGRTVEEFDVEHERAMHVIAVRHDLSGYQHVHPRQREDGSWEVDIAFSESGPHRVFADFSSGGRSYTLGADVESSGAYAARELPAPAVTASTSRYAVELHREGDKRHFTVSEDGRTVDDIEPYLGARGHLVALREDDLAFQHVHPLDAAASGREISFDVALSKPGRYRLFLQFKHEGTVRTVAFTETVAASQRDHGDGGRHAH
jgi:hypothetical protein